MIRSDNEVHSLELVMFCDYVVLLIRGLAVQDIDTLIDERANQVSQEKPSVQSSIHQ